MLLNLLARFDGIITRIDLACPVVPLGSRVVPGASEDNDLATAIVDRANAVQAVPVAAVPIIAPGSVDMHFIVGPGDAVDGAIRMYGDGWTGAMSPSAVPGGRGSSLPFGPYVAACLAAADVFLTVRGFTPPEGGGIAYSIWSFTPVDLGYNDGTVYVPLINVDAAVAGVGAVGSTWVHAIWAVQSLRGKVMLADSDPDGVTTTNLNRCPLFFHEALGRSKAEVAAELCQNDDVVLAPHHARLQDLVGRPPLVLSAVDKNTERASIQALYPSRLFSASTRGLSAELLRCDPASGAPCIRCYNPPEKETTDDELRRQFRAAPRADQIAVADELGISTDAAMRWALEGECGYAGDRVMELLRATTVGVNAFAVGFVSVMAGTMLAAQTVKELMGSTHPFVGSTCRAVFNFLALGSDRNAPTPYGRDPACAMCDPATPASDVWRTRYAKGLAVG